MHKQDSGISLAFRLSILRMHYRHPRGLKRPISRLANIFGGKNRLCVLCMVFHTICGFTIHFSSKDRQSSRSVLRVTWIFPQVDIAPVFSHCVRIAFVIRSENKASLGLVESLNNNIWAIQCCAMRNNTKNVSVWKFWALFYRLSKFQILSTRLREDHLLLFQNLPSQMYL